MCIEGALALQIQEALMKTGFLDSVQEGFPESASRALQEWINTNNFENKARDDGTIWQSVLDFLLNQ